MTTPAAEFTVFRAPGFVCIRIVGRANFAGGPLFKRAINDLLSLRPARLVIDLQSCSLMDSTFLGTLVGTAMQLHTDRPGECFVELSNPNPRVAGLVESLRAGEWFQQTAGSLDLPADAQFELIPNLDCTAQELMETSQKAHENLYQLTRVKKHWFTESLRYQTDDERTEDPRDPTELQRPDMKGLLRQEGSMGKDLMEFARWSDRREAALIADLSGQGATGHQVVECGRLLRGLMAREFSPAELFRAALSFVPMIPQGVYLTALYVVVDPVTRSCSVARAGHEPLLWCHAYTAEVESIQPEGVALGSKQSRRNQATFEELELSLLEGDVLLMHTDGLTMSRSPSGEQFGHERLKRLLSDLASHDARTIMRRVFLAVEEFTEHAPLVDASTVVVIKAP